MVGLRKKNRIWIASSLFLSLGCATSKYHVHQANSLGTDIETTPDRLIVECEFITDYEGDYKKPYGFMIHVLDNEKTVLTVSNGTVLEKEDCLTSMRAAEKIIENGNKITVRGRGDANAPVEMGKFLHIFPKHGRFRGNGRSLNYLAIWNDYGQCYDAFYGAVKPCPRKE